MDRRAIDAAAISLAKADAALIAMKASTLPNDFAKYETAWSDFLIASHRVFSKLQQGAKSDPTSAAWFAMKIRERKSDELLAYLHHARNVDEHGLALVTERQSPSFAIGSTGTTHIKSLVISGKDVKARVTGDPLKINFSPADLRLVTVTDRGVAYRPPVNHLSLPLKDTSPAGVSELAVLYLRTMLSDAERHLRR